MQQPLLEAGLPTDRLHMALESSCPVGPVKHRHELGKSNRKDFPKP